MRIKCHSSYSRFIRTLAARAAAHRGDVSLFLFLDKNGLLDTEFDYEIFDIAVLKEYISVLDWLYDTKGMRGTVYTIMDSVSIGSVKLMKWFKQRRYALVGVIDKAARYGKVNLVEWLIDNVYYNLHEVIDGAIIGGHTDVLDLIKRKSPNWIVNFTHSDQRHIWRMATYGTRINLTDWLRINGFNEEYRD